MSKILFICKDVSSYGHGYGLGNSASFVCNYLNKKGYHAKMVKATDGNCIDRLVTEYNPEFVVIEALWVTPDKLEELLNIKRHQDRTWIVRIHSRLSFLAHEGMAFEWLCGYKKIMEKFSKVDIFIAPNTAELTQDLNEIIGLNTVYLPNIYCPPDYKLEDKEELEEKDFIKKNVTMNIGCFGAVRPFKNQLTQGIAAIRFAESKNATLRFHINGTRCEQKGDSVLKNLRSLFDGQQKHKLVEHTWYDHADFIKTVRKMTLGMQVSFSETFNLVAADFVYCDVPIIGSSQIEWLPRMFAADCNSTQDMCDKLSYAWSVIGYTLRRLNKSGLQKFNNQAEKIWLDLMTGMIE